MATTGPAGAEQILAHVTPQTYAIHHWTGSWWRDALIVSARRRILNAKELILSEVASIRPGEYRRLVIP